MSEENQDSMNDAIAAVSIIALVVGFVSYVLAGMPA